MLRLGPVAGPSFSGGPVYESQVVRDKDVNKYAVFTQELGRAVEEKLSGQREGAFYLWENLAFVRMVSWVKEDVGIGAHILKDLPELDRTDKLPEVDELMPHLLRITERESLYYIPFDRSRLTCKAYKPVDADISPHSEFRGDFRMVFPCTLDIIEVDPKELHMVSAEKLEKTHRLAEQLIREMTHQELT